MSLLGLPVWLRLCLFGQPACAHKGFHSCEAIWRDWNRKRKQFIQAKWALRALTPLAPCQPNKSDWWFSSYKYSTGKCLDMIIALLPWMEDLLACEFESFCIVVCFYVFVTSIATTPRLTLMQTFKVLPYKANMQQNRSLRHSVNETHSQGQKLPAILCHFYGTARCQSCLPEHFTIYGELMCHFGLKKISIPSTKSRDISSIFRSTDTPRDWLDLGEERWRESVSITSL